MSYKNGEILITEQVEAVGGFSGVNVGRGTKWRLLNSGDADHYAVVRKGQHTEAFETKTQKERRYRTVIEVLQQVSEDLTDRYDDLLGYADAITDRLDKYWQLADTTGDIVDANVSGGDEVKEVWIRDVLAWIKVEIFVDWLEVVHVVFAE